MFSKAHLVLAACAAAVFFFACAVFTLDLGNLNLIAAGLLALACGLVLERLP